MASPQALHNRLVEIIKFFRGVGDPKRLWDQEGRGQQLQLWWFPEQEAALRELAADLVKENPMLSELEVMRELTYDAIAPAIHRWFGDITRPAAEVAQAKVADLLAFKCWTEVELPILYLRVPEPVSVSGVTFEALDIEHCRKSPSGEWTYKLYDGRLSAKARVNSPGDEWRYLTNAVEQIDGALRLLCGMAFPWQVRQSVIPAIAGTGLQPGATPFRNPSAHGNPGWNGSFGALHRAGGTMPVMKVLGDLWGTEAPTVLALASVAKPSETERRVITAFRWLGESARAYDRAGKLVAAVTALEALLAIHNDHARTSAGVTALLAERSAFLSSQTHERLETHRRVAEIYGLRSALVHGRVADAASSDTEAAGMLAWKVAKSLFEKRQELPSDASVTEWVLAQRYGGVETSFGVDL